MMMMIRIRMIVVESSMIMTRMINMMMILISIITTMIIIPELALVEIMFIANITSRRNNSPSTIHIATLNPPRYHQPSAMYLTKKHNDDDNDVDNDDNDDDNNDFR